MSGGGTGGRAALCGSGGGKGGPKSAGSHSAGGPGFAEAGFRELHIEITLEGAFYQRRQLRVLEILPPTSRVRWAGSGGGCHSFPLGRKIDRGAVIVRADSTAAEEQGGCRCCAPRYALPPIHNEALQ